jgi:hypothetical protein
MNGLIPKPVLFLALLFVAGCTAPTAETVDANTLPGPRAGTSLTKGMTAGEVRELWGDPQEIRPLKAESETADVWVYERMETENLGQFESGMVEVPYMDPVTGETRMTQEPRYETKFGEVKFTTELLIFEGKLIEWKQYRKVL